MNIRNYVLTGLVLSALTSTAAMAHDPALHSASDDAKKAKPTTCAQLADREHYSNDLSDPDIKALKAKCDADKKAPAQAKPAAQADGKRSN